jgi:hypothetical protein
MKIIWPTILLALTTLSIQANTDNKITGYERIQIREVAHSDAETMHLGVILHFKGSTELGVYGVKKMNKFAEKKKGYVLLGKIKFTQISVGVLANLSTEFDAKFSLNRMNGARLEDLCGNYYGVRAGLTGGIGTSGFSAINGSGIILRSNSINGGLQMDLSLTNPEIQCLDESNPNWSKVVELNK